MLYYSPLIARQQKEQERTEETEKRAANKESSILCSLLPLCSTFSSNLPDTGSYCPLKSAAKARALSPSPVACRVSSFQGSDRPGSKTRFFMKTPTPLSSTYTTAAGSAPCATSRAIA